MEVCVSRTPSPTVRLPEMFLTRMDFLKAEKSGESVDGRSGRSEKNFESSPMPNLDGSVFFFSDLGGMRLRRSLRPSQSHDEFALEIIHSFLEPKDNSEGNEEQTQHKKNDCQNEHVE